MEIRPAYCILKRASTVNLWVVPRCPYCGLEHVHGGCYRNEDPRQFLGHRVPHCFPPPEGSYVLVEADDPILRFVEECCLETRRWKDAIYKSEFASRLNEWVQAKGYAPFQLPQIGKRMHELGFSEWRMGKKWAWVGIRWRNE